MVPMVSDWLWDYSGERVGRRDVGFLARWKMNVRNPPYNIFGFRLWACHGIPAVVTLGAALVIGVCLFETASQFIKPVELNAIWFEPNKVTAAEILAQTASEGPLHLHKTGKWNRLCEVTAQQSFVTERGGETIHIRPHKVETPKETGPIYDKPRPHGIRAPVSLAAEVIATQKPITVKFRIDNYGVCWPLEKLINIGGMYSEATFTIEP